MEHHIAELGVESPFENLKEYHAGRNRSIAESFRKIQQLIADRGIDRKSLQLKSCTANGVREIQAPNGTSTQAAGFTIILVAGGRDWRFAIDDGLVDGDLWFFMDSPTNLFTGDGILSFTDHLKGRRQRGE
ncbi:MAG: hypothetical protein Fues2KO_06360 [Fuerstiella sp.]